MVKNFQTSIYIFTVFLVFSCMDSKKEEQSKNSKTQSKITASNEINRSHFEKEIDGNQITTFKIINSQGISALFTNYGQRLISLYVPDKNGQFDDVVLGFDNLDDYLNAKEKYFGATIGRYGNRIKEGKFTLDGKLYSLAVNNGVNHLHGGNSGFNDVIWQGDKINESEVIFSRLSPDGEEGYPGNLKIRVRYSLTEDNELKIKYSAETDKPTIINLTHHSFFNLKGAGNGSINNHQLMINADRYTPVDEGLIPLGGLDSVTETPFDFLVSKPIGRDLNVKNKQLLSGKGYDHNFILNKTPLNNDGLVLAAKVEEPISGRVMEVYTDEPGLQFYGGNFLDGKAIGKQGKAYDFRSAFCLETQHFPDSPNQKSFPSTVLRPGEIYESNCTYKFSIAN